MYNSAYGPYYGGGFNSPLLHSSYLPDQRYYNPRHEQWEAAARQREDALRARTLAERRARRAQWLPEENEDNDSDEDWEYKQLGPRERMYFDAVKRQQQLERDRREQEAECQTVLEEQKWQKGLEQRKREDDERRRQILAGQRKTQQQRREKAKVQAEAETTRQISPMPHLPKVEAEGKPEPAQRQYKERHEEAASRIQTAYRIHRSFRSIQEFEYKFNELKQNFTFPTTIDFQSKQGVATVEVHRPPPPSAPEDDTSMPLGVDKPERSAKLAYTSTNYPLHAYMENLSRLLTQLDGVESWGNTDVRMRRRAVVKDIEGELSRVDVYWKGSWGNYVQWSGEGAAVEVGGY